VCGGSAAVGFLDKNFPRTGVAFSHVRLIVRLINVISAVMRCTGDLPRYEWRSLCRRYACDLSRQSTGRPVILPPSSTEIYEVSLVSRTRGMCPVLLYPALVLEVIYSSCFCEFNSIGCMQVRGGRAVRCIRAPTFLRRGHLRRNKQGWGCSRHRYVIQFVNSLLSFSFTKAVRVASRCGQEGRMAA